MAITVGSAYTDPGVYISEVIVPGSVATSSSRILNIVATAPRTRRSIDEAVIRGKVYDEDLTAWTLTTPFRCMLAEDGNRDRNMSTLYKNGNPVAMGAWSYVPASYSGAAWGAATINMIVPASKNRLSLSIDGRDPVTIDFETNPGGTVPDRTAVTGAQLVACINYELGNAAGSHYAKYGTAYAAVASTAGVNPTITITSPTTGAASDIRFFLSAADAIPVVPRADGFDLIFNKVAPNIPTADLGIRADVYVEVDDNTYSSTATWTVDYVALDDIADPLTYATTDTPLDAIISVGSFPGAISYTQDTDYEDTGNTIDWNVAAVRADALITGIAGNYLINGANQTLSFSLNGLATITVTLTNGAAVTAATVAQDINRALAASATYGPEYGWSALDAGANTIRLRVRTPFEDIFPSSQAAASSITFTANATNAFTTLFGIAAASLPYSVYGTATRPDFATTYYVTYDYDRATTDYDTPWRVYNHDQLINYTSPLTDTNYTTNALAICGDLAFENNAPSIYLTQINDLVSPGTPTVTEVLNALEVAETKAAITDVVVINCNFSTATNLAAATGLMNHVADMSSLTEKKYRRGWFGMARGTTIGDPDTANTFVYRASRTLQPGGTSVARGRLILVAPSEANRTITLDDGTEISIEVDGSYIACAIAALSTSLASPSDTLVRKTIRGFDADDTFETYLKAERHTLADNGVTVVTYDAGKFTLLDAVTTEGALVASLPQFEEPMASAQRDAVVTTVDALVDANLVGVVPDDLTDFLTDIKKYIMLGILANIDNGSIAPYRDDSGNTRDIDPLTDIQVWQSELDPRTYLFNFWFNLKYPAKRFYGQYSVDNPFFSA